MKRLAGVRLAVLEAELDAFAMRTLSLENFRTNAPSGLYATCETCWHLLFSEKYVRRLTKLIQHKKYIHRRRLVFDALFFARWTTTMTRAFRQL